MREVRRAEGESPQEIRWGESGLTHHEPIFIRGVLQEVKTVLGGKSIVKDSLAVRGTAPSRRETRKG